MDGSAIQHAAEVALAGGTKVTDAFTATAALAEVGAPSVVMTYWNLVLRRGVERFAADLAAVGGSGVEDDKDPDQGGQ